jgi:hypothetical protein
MARPRGDTRAYIDNLMLGTSCGMIRHSVRELLQTRRLFVVIFAIGLFVMATRNVTDPDVWWHLRTGQLILQSHHVVHSDPFSFTRAGAPWVDHEWLSQILIYSLYRLGGWAALMMTFGALIAAGLLLVFARSPGKPYIAGIVTLLAAFASAPSWGVRPQMLTFVLASVFLLLLERSQQNPKILWWMAPLMLLWANLHAGLALGIALLILFAVGELLDIVFGYGSWSDAKRRLGTLTAVGIVSLAVVAVNPYGARLYSYPFDTLHSAAMQGYIGEWQSPDFHDPKYLPLLAMILGTLLLPSISPRKLRPRELLLLVAFTFAALRSVRHIPLYVLVAAPLLSAMLDGWMTEKRWALGLAEQTPSRAKAILNGAILAIFTIFMVARLGYVAGNQSHVEAKEFPEAGVGFLRSHALPGPILNHYNWGGYFIWKLYPEYRVFIDGRADVYGDEFMNEFALTYAAKGRDWREPLDRWGIRTIVLPPDSPLLAAIRALPAWRLAYSDPQVEIFTKEP